MKTRVAAFTDNKRLPEIRNQKNFVVDRKVQTAISKTPVKTSTILPLLLSEENEKAFTWTWFISWTRYFDIWK